MTKNKYIKGAHIKEAKFRKVLFAFCVDLTVTQISELTKINRKTANRIVQKIRIRISQICEEDIPFKGKIELDESYFGPKNQSGKRGRGASKKTIAWYLQA